MSRFRWQTQEVSSRQTAQRIENKVFACSVRAKGWMSSGVAIERIVSERWRGGWCVGWGAEGGNQNESRCSIITKSSSNGIKACQQDNKIRFFSSN